MKLSRKTFLYSLLISLAIVTMIIIYFTTMLPSLYVTFMEERNYDQAVKLQQGFMETGTYQGLTVPNPTGTATIRVPKSGDTVFVISKIFEVSIEVKHQELKKVIELVRYYAANPDKMEQMESDSKKIDWKALQNEMGESLALMDQSFFAVTGKVMGDESLTKVVKSKFHQESDDLFIFESVVSDGNNSYTSYIALAQTDQDVMITFIPVMSPSMDEIRPVVFQSLPMIVAVALLWVLLASNFFSRAIILPIIRLSKHAEYMREAKNMRLEPVQITGKDEISSLGESLNKLYEKIQESYQELEIKNQQLSEENKRQEVFLRASSHQLKTPISAAMLLVQSMIGEVGKYKDTKAYLPQVKQQLQSLQRMVEDILALNPQMDKLVSQDIVVDDFIKACLNEYQLGMEAKGMTLTWQQSKEKESITWRTDPELFKKIMDNLLSNAVVHGTNGGEINIQITTDSITLTNAALPIEDDLLPHIFEPFVTSSSKEKGRGIGLYVVAYYARILGMHVAIQNVPKGVQTTIHSHNPHHTSLQSS